MKYAVYVGLHKDVELPQSIKNNFDIIKMGPSKHNLKIHGAFDDTGDNISKKNANYSELTAEYWILKNVDADIKGFQHYRRFFSTGLMKPMTKSKILKDLEKNDIIVSEPTAMLRHSVWEYYAKNHRESDLILLRQTIQRLFPEYIKDFDEVMNGKYSYNYNMIIANEKVYNAYFNWLFKILFEVEKRDDISTLDPYQARIFGFMSERLLNVWIKHNHLKRKCRFVINTDWSKYQNFKFKWVNRIKYTLSYLNKK